MCLHLFVVVQLPYASHCGRTQVLLPYLTGLQEVVAASASLTSATATPDLMVGLITLLMLTPAESTLMKSLSDQLDLAED